MRNNKKYTTLSRRLKGRNNKDIRCAILKITLVFSGRLWSIMKRQVAISLEKVEFVLIGVKGMFWHNPGNVPPPSKPEDYIFF